MQQKQPPEVSIKKSVLRNFTKFTGKHLCQSLFFNKVAGLRSATLLKKGLWHKCFPVNFVKVLRTPFLQNTSGRLLLMLNVQKTSIWCSGPLENLLRVFSSVCWSSELAGNHSQWNCFDVITNRKQ